MFYCCCDVSRSGWACCGDPGLLCCNMENESESKGNWGGGSSSPRGCVKDFSLFLDADSRLLTNPTSGKTVPNFCTSLRHIIQVDLKVEAICLWLLNHMVKTTGSIILGIPWASRMQVQCCKHKLRQEQCQEKLFFVVVVCHFVKLIVEKIL